MSSLPVKPAHGPEPEIQRAIEAWNLMGGQLDWSAIEILAEMLGELDIEGFVRRIAGIRAWKQQNRD